MVDGEICTIALAQVSNIPQQANPGESGIYPINPRGCGEIHMKSITNEGGLMIATPSTPNTPDVSPGGRKAFSSPTNKPAVTRATLESFRKVNPCSLNS